MRWPRLRHFFASSLQVPTSRSDPRRIWAWLESQLKLVPERSDLAEAIRYTLKRRPAPCLFLDSGRIELDTNPVDHAICPATLGRKNYLFAGSSGGSDRWAIAASRITTARLDHVGPQAWLTHVLGTIAAHPIKKIDELLPWMGLLVATRGR